MSPGAVWMLVNMHRPKSKASESDWDELVRMVKEAKAREQVANG